MFKKIALFIVALQLISLVLLRDKIINAADTFQGVFASSSSATNITIGTNTQVLTYDPSRVHWNIHPEGTNGIRCIPGLSNGQVSGIAPTTTVGEEMLGNGYFDSEPFTPPQLSMNCTAESGSVSTSVWQDYK